MLCQHLRLVLTCFLKIFLHLLCKLNIAERPLNMSTLLETNQKVSDVAVLCNPSVTLQSTTIYTIPPPDRSDCSILFSPYSPSYLDMQHTLAVPRGLCLQFLEDSVTMCSNKTWSEVSKSSATQYNPQCTAKHHSTLK